MNMTATLSLGFVLYWIFYNLNLAFSSEVNLLSLSLVSLLERTYLLEVECERN